MSEIQKYNNDMIVQKVEKYTTNQKDPRTPLGQHGGCRTRKKSGSESCFLAKLYESDCRMPVGSSGGKTK